MTLHIQAWRRGFADEPMIECEPGSRADYDALSPLHYRAGPPATVDRIIKATDYEHGVLAGVLVTSRPTLNGAWRRIAWGDRFATGDRSRDAREINAHLRTISRVVVDPRFRGLGVGTGLVRCYLDTPATPCTEALTAMGDVCPFFERAGMKPISMPMQRRHATLMRALGETDAATAAIALLQADARATREQPLRRWASSNAATRRLAAGPIEAIAAAAAGALLAPPTAYAHG